MLHTILQDMFGLSLPLAEKVLRPIVVYAFLVIMFRLAGKREAAQLNPFDLVVFLTISNTVQNAIIGEDNSITGGLIGAATLFLVNAVVVRFLYRHQTLDRLVEGTATVLIDHGHVVQASLERELITRAELEAAAHKQGFASLSDVRRALLEPGGAISFIGREPAPDDARHRELLSRLDALQRQVAALSA